MWIKTTQLYIPILELDLRQHKFSIDWKQLDVDAHSLPAQMVVLLALLICSPGQVGSYLFFLYHNQGSMHCMIWVTNRCMN
jgi:hypothetical protein